MTEEARLRDLAVVGAVLLGSREQVERAIQHLSTLAAVRG
jgi:hypothetical protein